MSDIHARAIPVACAPTVHQKGECAGCSDPPGTFLVPNQTPEGAEPRDRTGQAVESAHPGGAVSASAPAAPSGPDPAALIASAVMTAARWVACAYPKPEPAWVETELAADIRKALESYR